MTPNEHSIAEGLVKMPLSEAGSVQSRGLTQVSTVRAGVQRWGELYTGTFTVAER